MSRIHGIKANYTAMSPWKLSNVLLELDDSVKTCFVPTFLVEVRKEVNIAKQSKERFKNFEISNPCRKSKFGALYKLQTSLLSAFLQGNTTHGAVSSRENWNRDALIDSKASSRLRNLWQSGDECLEEKKSCWKEEKSDFRFGWRRSSVAGDRCNHKKRLRRTLRNLTVGNNAITT